LRAKRPVLASASAVVIALRRTRRLLTLRILRNAAPTGGLAAVLANPSLTRVHQLRAEPIELLGLNLAILAV